MSLTEPQIRQLLFVAMGYDNRKPGDLNVAAWMEAAHLGRWTFDAALEAIHQHYAHTTEWLMPGHITQHVRADKRHPERYARQLPAAPPASPETRADAMRRIRAALQHRPEEESA